MRFKAIEERKALTLDERRLGQDDTQRSKQLHPL